MLKTSSKPEHVANFLRLYGLFYNRARTHMSLGAEGSSTKKHRV